MDNARYSRYYTYIKPVVQNRFVKSVAPYIFSIITVTMMLLLALKPTIETVLNLQKNIINNQQVLEALEKKVRDLSQGKKNLEELGEEKMLKINTSLPQTANITSLVAALQASVPQTASISALQVQPVSLQSKKDINLALNEISFSLSVQGSYLELTQTLERILNSPRAIQITGVTINKSADGITNLIVSGKGYFLQ